MQKNAFSEDDFKIIDKQIEKKKAEIQDALKVKEVADQKVKEILGKKSEFNKTLQVHYDKKRELKGKIDELKVEIDTVRDAYNEKKKIFNDWLLESGFHIF